MLSTSQKKLSQFINILKKFYKVVKIAEDSDDTNLVKEMSSLRLKIARLNDDPVDFIKNENNSRLKLISTGSVIDKSEVNYNPQATLIFIKGLMIITHFKFLFSMSLNNLKFMQDQEDFTRMKKELLSKENHFLVLHEPSPSYNLYQETITKAREGYARISNDIASYRQLVGKEIGDNVMLEEKSSIFSEPINHSFFTSIELPNRLKNPTNKSQLPFPAIFSPSRKSAIQEFFPILKQDIILEGFSQTGKSNFASHLTLLYRITKNAALYIGNVGLFANEPTKYLATELCYWFYEEIDENPVFQNIMQKFINDVDFFKQPLEYQWNILRDIIAKLRKACDLKKKKVILIIDTFNKRYLERKNLVLDEIYNYLELIATDRIYITTNTDQQTFIQAKKYEDYSSTKVVALDETNNPFPADQMEKVINKLLKGTTKDTVSIISKFFQANLPLILLFSNFCTKMKIELLDKNEIVFGFCEEFKLIYKTKCLIDHQLWRKSLSVEELEISSRFMLFLDIEEAPTNFNPNFLDLRFLFEKNQQIKSINCIAQEMLRDLYWKADFFESFLNQHYASLETKTFGSMFEQMILRKFQNEKNIKIIVDQKISFFINPNRYEKIKLFNEKIVFRSYSKDENILYIPPENFPLVDLIYYDGSTKTTYWIDVKISVHSKYKKNNYKTFISEAYQQLGHCYNHVFLYFIYNKPEKNDQQKILNQLSAHLEGYEIAEKKFEIKNHLIFYRDVKKNNQNKMFLKENLRRTLE